MYPHSRHRLPLGAISLLLLFSLSVFAAVGTFIHTHEHACQAAWKKGFDAGLMYGAMADALATTTEYREVSAETMTASRRARAYELYQRYVLSQTLGYDPDYDIWY